MIGCDSISRRGPRPSRCSGALTDFTESHLETWNRTLDPKTYELREAVRPGLWRKCARGVRVRTIRF